MHFEERKVRFRMRIRQNMLLVRDMRNFIEQDGCEIKIRTMHLILSLVNLGQLGAGSGFNRDRRMRTVADIERKLLLLGKYVCGKSISTNYCAVLDSAHSDLCR